MLSRQIMLIVYSIVVFCFLYSVFMMVDGRRVCCTHHLVALRLRGKSSLFVYNLNNRTRHFFVFVTYLCYDEDKLIYMEGLLWHS